MPEPDDVEWRLREILSRESEIRFVVNRIGSCTKCQSWTQVNGDRLCFACVKDRVWASGNRLACNAIHRAEWQPPG